MRVKELFRCLRCHTLESLKNYHDYLLYHSIENNKQPANLWLICDEDRTHVNKNAEWNYSNSEGDPLKEMLNKVPVTRQRTMGKIRRNNVTDSTNTLRFESFVPKSVRLFNRTPVELQHKGTSEWKDFKHSIKMLCMEDQLGNSIDWPNYDHKNRRILPCNRILLEQGNHAVKKRNGLFIEKQFPD